MHYARFMPDPIPKVSSAGGFQSLDPNNTAANCIRPGLTMTESMRSTTPEHIRKYRKSTNGEPGVIIVHPGLKEDVENMDRNRAFGKKATACDQVSKVIKAQNLNGLADKFNDMKEGQYASRQREPLGASYSRKYAMPDATQTDGFKFGVPSMTQISAKELIYPAGGSLEERPETAAMYVKTHGNIPAGAQKNRNYEWPVDPQQFVFGYGEKRVPNGAANSIHAERTDTAFPQTVVVQKTVEDVKSTIQDHLGKSKNLGQGVQFSQEQVFGYKNDPNGWNAAKCIHGEPNEREIQPDNDLGRCTKQGMRNTFRCEADAQRTFGCPSVRTDIPNKRLKSVADHQNYGDEPEAIDLLSPATFVEYGISEADFERPRPREEIRALFEKIGYSYKVGKFNAIFNRAAMYARDPYSVPENHVSIRCFMTAINDLHDVE